MPLSAQVSEVSEKWASLMIGERLFVDLANSLYDGGGTLPDPMATWDGALAFFAMSEGLGPEQADLLLPVRNACSEKRLLEELNGIRALVFDLTDNLSRGRLLTHPQVDQVNTLLSELDGGQRLSKHGDHYALVAEIAHPSPRQLFGLIGQSLARFLAEDDPKRLKKCANDACPLYFYDTSKNGRRRWCRMDLCGNRAKASAHYHRHKAAKV